MPQSRDERDFVYIFLHIPKCAGSTFRLHVQRNLRSDQIVELNLDMRFSRIGDPHIFAEVGLNSEYDRHLDERLESLSPAEKDKIRVIQGHGVYYGVHRFFNRPYRYFTFIRDPVQRAISEYNYLRMLHERPKPPEGLHQLVQRRCQNDAGEILDFKAWLEQKYHPTYQTAGFLHARGFLHLPTGGLATNRVPGEGGAWHHEAVVGNEAVEAVKDALDKFHFVGMTENFDEDALYLYHKLGFKKFYRNQNVSRPLVQVNREILDLAERKNVLDRQLYELSREANRRFREKHEDFSRLVHKMRWKKAIALPMTSIAAAARHRASLLLGRG